MNLFGTDGIRNRFGTNPLKTENLIDLARAIYSWSITKYESPKILIAHDTRISSYLTKSSITTGLLEHNVSIYDAQVLPTPGVYNLVQKQKLFDFGIVITASHNPYYDNGIKIVDSQVDKLEEKDEKLISQIFTNKTFETINYENLGKIEYYEEAEDKYAEYISKFFEPNFLKNINVALDCANGSTFKIAEQILTSFGAKVLSIGNNPNGKNINNNCGSTKPAHLLSFMKQNHTDIGFSFDGDGDRITTITKEGQIKDGDDILALLMTNPIYDAPSLVSTIMTNYGLEFELKQKNKNLIRTPVGDKYVAKTLKQENLLLGGEQSGHIICRDYLNSSDSIFTALRILETIQTTNNWSMNTFEKYPQVTINMPVEKKIGLEEEPFNTILKEYQQKISGRVIVRYSGTESLLRITVESQSTELSEKIAQNLFSELNTAFKNYLKGSNNVQNTTTQTI